MRDTFRIIDVHVHTHIYTRARTIGQLTDGVATVVEHFINNTSQLGRVALGAATRKKTPNNGSNEGGSGL